MIPPATTPILIAPGLEALQQQHPIAPGKVSPHRTFDGDGFRIRHLAFDSGAVLAEHTAPAPIIVQVVQGSVLFEVDGSVFTLSLGAILHLPADMPHQVPRVGFEPTLDRV